MCELASWIPNAVAVTLRAETAQPVIEWLMTIRQAIEEYDPLITVAPPEDEPDSPDSKFDEILSQLGTEIYKLDEYQRNLVPSEKEVSLSILNIFDECLDRMAEENTIKNSESECESTLSDISFVTSTPAGDKVNNINTIVSTADGTPVPAQRTRLKSICSNSDMESDFRRISDSDSESTCWSYKDCSIDDNEVNPYAAVWAHSTGFHNSDEILRHVLSQHHATISRLSFDTASEFIPDSYSVYSLHEVGECKDRCVDSSSVAMTPDKPADDGYEPVRDAITDENIYEEIEYDRSYTDEGCSCGSVEVESYSMSASSEGVGRESPLYVNLRDNDAYAITPDVMYWKNLLLDPYYNEDEEEEWITPEECEVYARDHRPTAPVIQCVIPRITQYRTPRVRQQTVGSTYHEENIPEQGSLKSRGFDALNNWSPASERCRVDHDMGYNKASSDSPPLARINKRLGGSTENLLGNPRRPFHIQLPASSSGDSLDVEYRVEEPSYSRNRKSRSMVAPKHRLRSPVPAPRYTLQQATEVIMEGPIKRTKFLEGAKKTKKNWIDCYMILTSKELAFYKDQRTYYSPNTLKPPGTPPSPSAPQPELRLSLCKALAHECPPKYTKRYQRSILLIVGCNQYLIQDETEGGAKLWLDEINRVIYNLFSRSQNGDPSAYQSSNTDQESLGRTPPAARHTNRSKQKAGGSSIEDLSDSADAIHKSHVRNRLRKFFAKRPAMEQLVKKGIYKDEPVFGRRLEEVCPPPSSPCRVPEFVVQCIKEIERDENICTDGLYRASGNLSQVQKIRLEVDQNNMSVIENTSDIHVLTGSLKLFFRELKEPLIPWSMFDRVLAACSIKPREARVKEFQSIVHALPQCNRDTLKYLLEHLLRVIKCSEKNRMHTGNLAIVFGPTLLWAPADKDYNIAVDCIQQNYVVEILLTDFNDIFTDNVGR